MATLLASLRARIQITLNDAGAGTWPDLTVANWICEAIRDYSQTFPRVRYIAQLVTSNPGYEWGLQSDFIGMVQVEYPTGEDPPVYLSRRARTHPQFYGHPGYYDFLHEGDASTGILYLSQIPTAGEYIGVTYLAAHDAALTEVGGDTITVPSEHEFLLQLHVLWSAFKERVATHLQDPDTTSDILQKMTNAEMQAHQEYRTAIKNAEHHRSQGGWAGPWKVDVYDPIY